MAKPTTIPLNECRFTFVWKLSPIFQVHSNPLTNLPVCHTVQDLSLALIEMSNLHQNMKIPDVFCIKMWKSQTNQVNMVNASICTTNEDQQIKQRKYLFVLCLHLHKGNAYLFYFVQGEGQEVINMWDTLRKNTKTNWPSSRAGIAKLLLVWTRTM